MHQLCFELVAADIPFVILAVLSLTTGLILIGFYLGRASAKIVIGSNDMRIVYQKEKGSSKPTGEEEPDIFTKAAFGDISSAGRVSTVEDQ